MTYPRNDVPTGTLTYLFTDVEGSTRLASQLGARFRAQLAEHDRIVGDAIFANHGAVSSTAGDSFFARFSDAPSAVAAAAAAQRGLNAFAWEREPMRARMGLHTAEASDEAEDYAEIARAARIMAAAHGGQVLLSSSTLKLVADHLPDGVRVRHLGAYRLKDIPEPEQLHQLEMSGLLSAFPPLRALDVRRAHVPPESTAFFGRGRELAVVAELIRDRRLVTLTGPGGTGKTRLAIRTAAQVAEHLADGAFFVALAASTDASTLPRAIAGAIGLPEVRDRTIGQVLSDWLREREVLLVLDNLEQLQGAAHEIHLLLSGAPRLRVLATSRAPLHVAGEQEFPVPPFAIPSTDADEDEVAASDAVLLFVDRARLVRIDFAPSPNDVLVIADITRRLDGLPLAIELAAARIRLLSVNAIRERLVHRLDALAAGPATAEPRQQSLRVTIAWSYDLLSEADRAVFRRLAAFVGGWTYDAAVSVAASDPAEAVDAAIERLVEQNLIQAGPASDAPRFAMLATIGEFASEALGSSDEESEIHRRHAIFFGSLAERAHAESNGPESSIWFDRVEADLDNVRAAIDRAVERNDLKVALAIAAALGPFWLQRNHSAEGQRVLIGLLNRAVPQEGPEVAAAASAAGFNATWLGDYETGAEMGELGISAYRGLGDRRGLAQALGIRGFSMIETDASAALGMLEEYLQLARQLGDDRLQGQALLASATAQAVLGRLSDARRSLEDSIGFARRANDWYFAMFSSLFLGRLKLLMGEMDEGIAEYRAVIETSRSLDLRVGIAIALEYFGEIAFWAGDIPRAVRLGATAARIKEELGGGIPPRIGGALEPLVVGQERLTPDAFDREVAAGRTMDLEAAIEEALSTPLPTSVPSQ